jgi:hypothetical protein
LRSICSQQAASFFRYFKRAIETTFELTSQLQEDRSKKQFMKNRGMSRYSSSLAILCYIDTSSELLMDCLCLLTNLWMVFGTSKPLEMILNSLALEFIKSIGASAELFSVSFS